MLSIQGLTKRFPVAEGRLTALKQLSLDVAEGEFFVLVGASGSGKTTLLRCVAGLEEPEGGEISIEGRVVYSDNPPRWVPPQQRKLGMVFQSYAIWPHLTVFDNVALPLREGTQRIEQKEVEARVRRALEMVQLDGLGNRPAPLLSGGQQQRVALARAIAVNSRVVLMDEPLSNLDARLREEVRTSIRDLAKQLGSTVLYVTHDQVEAMAMADRIALMRFGEILQVGTPRDLYHAPTRPEVADFFGAVNWLPGEVVQQDLVRTEVGYIAPEACLTVGEKVLLGVRPESLVPVPAGGIESRNVLEMRLVSTAFLGDQSVFRLAVGESVLSGKARVAPAALDGTARVWIAPGDVMVFPDASPPGPASNLDAPLSTTEPLSPLAALSTQ